MSAQYRGSARTEIAALVTGEEMRDPIVVERTACEERRSVEQGAQRAESVACDGGARVLAQEGMQEYRRDQRSVNDKARVTFNVRCVGPIIMDAVTIERKRGISK